MARLSSAVQNYNGAITQANRAPDPATRAAMTGIAQAIFYDNAARVLLYAERIARASHGAAPSLQKA